MKNLGDVPMNSLKNKLLERQITFGSWLQIGHPASVEVLDDVGFEWLVIDCEHGVIDLETAANMMRAMKRAIPVVRVAENSTISIRQALDAGACGVIVPMVNTEHEAEQAVKAAKYSPLGERGFGFCRANNYGVSFDDYVKRANDEIIVVVQVEHIKAVENIKEILKIEGIDGIFVGPYDITGSMGIPGQLDNSQMDAILHKIIEACKESGKSAGIHDVRPTSNSVDSFLNKGFTFLALGIDAVFMRRDGKDVLDRAQRLLKKIDKK